MVVYIFNTSIIPPGFTGMVKVRRITVEEAKSLIQSGFISSVGHDGTARFLSALLEVDVPTQRLNTRVRGGDKVVAFQLLERLPEGLILDEETLRKYRYELRVLEFK